MLRVVVSALKSFAVPTSSHSRCVALSTSVHAAKRSRFATSAVSHRWISMGFPFAFLPQSRSAVVLLREVRPSAFRSRHTSAARRKAYVARRAIKDYRDAFVPTPLVPRRSKEITTTGGFRIPEKERSQPSFTKPAFPQRCAKGRKCTFSQVAVHSRARPAERR